MSFGGLTFSTFKILGFLQFFRVGSTWLTVLPLQIWRTYNNPVTIILGHLRRFHPCKDAQKVSASPSACLRRLFESANDQRNKRKFSRT